jgi:hypothetical protein
MGTITAVIVSANKPLHPGKSNHKRVYEQRLLLTDRKPIRCEFLEIELDIRAQ